MKIVVPGEAGMDPNIECSPYARPREYWDQWKPTDWHLSADRINEPQQESMEKLLPKLRAARWINLVIRKDGVETTHQADWVKHLRKAEPEDPKPREFVTVTAADFNGSAWDGQPLKGAESQPWVTKAIVAGKIAVHPDSRDYCLWKVKTRYRTVIAEPGDQIIRNEDGTLSVLVV